MSSATRRLSHTCQYNRPCAACAKAGRTPVTAAIHATMRTALERTRTYRGQECIESIKLPRWKPGADGYGKNGEPRYLTRAKYINAGRSCSMEWQ